jgi:hypothetical protein
MGMVRNFGVMLGQTLNHSVYNSVISEMLYICNPFKFFSNIRKVGEFVLSRIIIYYYYYYLLLLFIYSYKRCPAVMTWTCMQRTW